MSNTDDMVMAEPKGLRAHAGKVLAIAMAAAALVTLHQMISGVDPSDIRRQAFMLSPHAILAAVLATAASFVALGLYDVIASRSVAPGRVTWQTAALSGMAGYAFSNLLGFHLLTGGAIRFRTYSRSGLDAGEIGQIVLLTWLAIWLAFAVVVSMALIFDPAGIPLMDLIHPAADRLLGVAILLGLIFAIVRARSHASTISLFGWTIPLPQRNMILLQLLVGTFDIVASAATLYVLLPADVSVGPALFLTVYATALVVGAISHVPGGIGVFEATVIAGLGLAGRADVLAALVVYRLIYYVLPFVVAALLLAAFESRYFVSHLPDRLSAPLRSLKTMMPLITSAIVFLSGIVLLLSGATPGIPARLDALEDVLPLSLVESSHFLGSLLGLALLIVAYGLRRRLFHAWAISMVLLVLGALASLAKGIDWEEAMVLGATALFLLLCRDAFYRRAPLDVSRVSWRWLGLIGLVVAATTWLGYFSYSDVEYSNQLFWQFEWSSDATRFLRATIGLAIGVIALAMYRVVHQPGGGKARAKTEVHADIADIVALSPDTQANIALLGDKEFLLSSSEKTFIMYGRAGNSLVSMGDPIGNPAEANELVWRFREVADKQAKRAVFYGVQPENLPLYLDMGYSLLKLGEVARVNLQAFNLEGQKNQEFRYADRRATREEITFEIIPAAQVPSIMGELREVSDTWLKEKNGSEKGFSLGHFDPAYLARFDCAVMRQHGRIVAFANIWRGGGVELSVDLMRYKSGVSKVLMDALFVRLFLYGKEQGYAWFNLGAAPLSGIPDHSLASRWSRLARLAFRYGDEFYNFGGLRAFKQKFSPVWTPHYLACPGGFNIPQVLLDINFLVSGGLGRLMGANSNKAPGQKSEAA
ncbi:bifunctional lysylphosphatidylglycerol flippase/synthetase MprF [Mesorhizobium sp. PAMC28654]|uniref:bifunctional lysylphosphatidylglycerol flippase/synthetase MprF n=1 Tax=Mesorhizobium sp. PAMC28654 TaxID=2880934 RepID=UPI001D0A46CA|nr:bifunctional lysylphosphatidylglycerol flippase/synthetase MprF [Mesorhizobium sp. PAMC28654]UDL87285.1 bifunctional lysylphosphatidylglycerol flippase/synthetase MprF [Mesorhizobium sp. PAMC28654]